MDHSETMHTCCGYIEDVHVNFCRGKIIFDKITAFWTYTIFRLGFNLDLENLQVRLQYGVASLCNQLLPEFSDVISILKMCMRLLAGKKIIFDKITAFWT